MVSLKSVQMVSSNGNALIVNIPKKIVDIMGIKIGDYLSIDWGEGILNVASKKEVKKEKEKKMKIVAKDDEEEELPQI